MSYSVFDANNKKDHTKVNCFFDDAPTIARYDRQKYPWIEKLTDRQLGFFWRPEEVDIYKDAKDFKDLTVHEQHIFTSNLKRQILLDSVQGRAPTMAFGPICSLPELETWITTWAFSETIHSRSYTHIIRNIYPNPSKIFDEIMDIPEIVDCACDISKYYDDLIDYAGYYKLLGYGSSAASAPIPNGNKLVTTTKKKSAVSTSLLRRITNSKSRLTIANKALIGLAPLPQAAQQLDD
jgi:ribonucleoside-diphosphate reductase beta chain